MTISTSLAGSPGEPAGGVVKADPLLSRGKPTPERPGEQREAVPPNEGVSVKAAERPTEQPGECRSTPLTPTELASALYDGHIAQFGEPPRIERLACAWAHCALENARGAVVYENNIGNVTAPDGQRSCAKRIHERVSRSPDRWELIAMHFRAFDTPAAGAAAYWKLLARSYNSVIARCDAADSRGAAVRLSELGYFTGRREPYVAGMQGLFAHANHKLRGPSFLAPGSL